MNGTHRYIEVVDDRMTGEVLLDEALKMMKVSERMSIGSWVDLMSGQSLASFLLLLSRSVLTCSRTAHSRFPSEPAQAKLGT